MKKLLSVLTCTALLAALAGCSPTPPAETTLPSASTQPAATTVPAETTLPPAAPSGAYTPAVQIQLIPHEQIFTAEGDADTRLLTYRWQEILVTAPNGVGENISGRLGRNHEYSVEFADEILRLATAEHGGSSSFRPYSYEVTMAPHRVDDAIISFSGVIWTFTGGIHPNQTHISISYDAATGDPLAMSDVFPGEGAADAVRQLVIQKLDEEKDMLYPGYEAEVSGSLTADKTPYGFFYFTQEGMTFFFSPYVIAPYARGVVEVRLSYEELDGLLDPKWLPVPTSASGTVVISENENTDVTVSAGEGGEQVLLEVQGDVSGLRIQTHMTNVSADTSRTLYQAPVLVDGTRILLTMPDNPMLAVVVSYHYGGDHSLLFNLEAGESGYTLSPIPSP